MEPQAIADGVYWLGMGRGLTQSNVYFVRSGPSWVLIDTGWAHDARVIRAAAQAMFGPNSSPTAILLTHNHPDHAGAAVELARLWHVPVYLHPNDLALVPGNLEAAEATPAGPLDRWVILPIMRALPRRAREALRTQGAAFTGVARTFDPGEGVPGLPDWECLPTPGHSPGHVAYFRRRDRVLITGDAVVTLNLNSVWGLLRQTHRPAAPPYITTWNWQMAKDSVAALVQLEPRVLAGGHGVPITQDAAAQLRAFAAHFTARAASATATSSDVKPAAPTWADWFLFALSATGVPLGIFVLPRLGRRGGLLMEVACGALGVRAATMITMGAPRRLNVLARLLLYAETIADGLATLAGFWAWVWHPFVRPVLQQPKRSRTQRQVGTRQATRVSSGEQATWAAVATWMAAMLLHATRMAIYVSPTRGLRSAASAGTSSVDRESVRAQV